MTDLTTKANGVKTVTAVSETKANNKTEKMKVDEKKLIIETTAEKRLKNLENFQKVCMKFNFLKKKSDDLNAYMIGRDGLKETLIIENTDGQTFEISNTLIIAEILNLGQTKLFELLEKAEKEVLDFNI